MTESFESPRILVVDDVTKNIQVVGTILRRADYQIYVAQNGQQALEMAEEIQPDLILLDVMMPGIDGFETCRRLKQNPDLRDIPVIFLTAHAEDEAVVRGLEAGAVDYVAKPFNASVLLARVKTHLTLSRQTKQLQTLAEKDGLTLLANRRRFDEFLNREWRRCMRNGTPLALIMLDIDNFKLYNDTYGHLQGDEVLRSVAQVLQDSVQRPGDLAARYGGEEFAVILSSELEYARQTAENIRANIEQAGIEHKASSVSGKAVLTASLGAACMVPERDDMPQTLIDLADKKLYEAKGAGRNQVKV